MASLQDAVEHYLEVFVNPYTGKIMGDRQWETSWIGRVCKKAFKNSDRPKSNPKIGVRSS